MESPVSRRPRFFYGWLIVGACVSMGMAHAGVLNPMLSLFMKPMAAEFGWTRTMFSAAVFIGALGGGLLSLVVGPLIDKRGPRIVMVAGAAIIGTCLALLSKIGALWHFYSLYGLARSVLGGATGLAVPTTVANWFIRKRGRATGIALAGPGVGGVLLPLLIQWLITSQGWRFTWMTLGIVLGLIAIIPAALFVRRRPEDMGLMPDGEVPPESKESTTSSKGQQPGKGVPAGEAVWTRKAAMGTAAFWLIAFAESLGMMVFGAMNMHKFPYLTDIGIPAALAAGTVSLAAVCSSTGGFLWGLLAEKIQPKYCLIFCLCAQAVSVLVLMSVRTVPMAYVFAAMWGFSMGGLIPMFGVVWADYFGRMSLGTIRGLSIPIRLLGNTSGPMLAGLVFDITGSYHWAFIGIISIFIFASLLVFISRAPRYTPSPEQG